MLVCDMEKYKRPPLQQEPNVYIEPKWLRCPQCCSGLELIGPAHEDLETPEAVLGQALRLEVILLSKEKAAAPRPKPRGRPRQASRHREANPPKPSKPSNPLQNPPNPPNPPNTSPTGTPGPRPLLNQAPRAKATAMAFYWLSKLPFASPQTLQTLQNPPNLQTPSKTLQTLQAWRHALSRWPKGYGS